MTQDIITPTASESGAVVATGTAAVSPPPATAAGTTPAASLAGLGTATATLPASSATASAPAPGLFAGALATQTVTRTLAWGETQTRAVAWGEIQARTLPWGEIQQRTLDTNTMSEINPHDHYISGESEVWEFTIQKDGSDYDVSGATVNWYLLPLGADVLDVPDDLSSEAVLSDSDTGISLSISDPDGDGTSELLTLDIEQDTTGTEGGYYTHVLVLDDSGTGQAIWSGDFPIQSI